MELNEITVSNVKLQGNIKFCACKQVSGQGRACLGKLVRDHNPGFDREFKLFSRNEVTLPGANIFRALPPAKTPFSVSVKRQPQKFHSEILTSTQPVCVTIQDTAKLRRSILYVRRDVDASTHHSLFLRRWDMLFYLTVFAKPLSFGTQLAFILLNSIFCQTHDTADRLVCMCVY